MSESRYAIVIVDSATACYRFCFDLAEIFGSEIFGSEMHFCLF